MVISAWQSNSPYSSVGIAIATGKIPIRNPVNQGYLQSKYRKRDLYGYITSLEHPSCLLFPTAATAAATDTRYIAKT